MAADVHPTATVYPGTVLGEGVKVLENAVVGKQPALSPRSTAKREPLPPTEIGDGTIVSTGAIVFAGSRIGARVILGDQSCVRERVTIGDDVVLGRGSLVENDTTIGALTRIQAEAYITAYSTLEEHVFIAPCVVTTNDNFMGRTEQRHELIAGPTIRRGARVGGGAILCPGVEIGEEAFVGAGAVVTKNVPPRVIVVGNPARVLRDVPSRRAARRLALDDRRGDSASRPGSTCEPGRSTSRRRSGRYERYWRDPLRADVRTRYRESATRSSERACGSQNARLRSTRRVGSGQADVHGLVALEPDRVDVVLIVPEVDARLDSAVGAVRRVRPRAEVVVRLVEVAFGQLLCRGLRSQRRRRVDPSPSTRRDRRRRRSSPSRASRSTAVD